MKMIQLYEKGRSDMEKIKNLKFFEGLSINILLLGLVSLFTDLSSQMVFPLLPLFLTTALGAQAYIVGLVEGAAETTASLLRIVSGYWSDKVKKRKPFILLGYSLSTITKPLFAFANVWFFVLFVRVIERIGKGIRTVPRDALIAESSDETVRGKAFGLQRAMDGIGSMLGAVLAFLLLPVLGFRNTFLFAFLPGILAVVAILFVKEKRAPVSALNTNISIKLSFSELSQNLRVFILASSLFSIGHFGYAFLLLRVLDIGLSNETAIFLYMLFYLSHSLFSVPLGIVSDRIGRKAVLSMGYALFIALAVGLYFARDIYSLLICFLAYGLFFAMIDGVQRAFVVDLSPAHLKATALGTFHAATGLVALPAAFIIGLIWERLSPEASFLYGAFFALAALIVLLFVKEKERFLK